MTPEAQYHQYTQKPKDSFFIRHATGIAISVITLVMGLCAAIIWQQNESGDIARKWVEHTYTVSNHIQLLLNRIKDVELGERGYIISGNEAYLGPYHDALTDAPGTTPENTKFNLHNSIAQEIAILRRLTVDNPAQGDNLDELDRYVKELMQYWSSSIELRRKGVRSGSAIFSSSHGLQLMDNVRTLTGAMVAEENHLLDLRVAASSAAVSMNLIIIFTSIGILYLIMVLLVWLYQHSRERSGRQLKRYTEELEKSEEELRIQQEELQAANEEMETSNEELEEKTRALEEQNLQVRQQSELLTLGKRQLEEKAAELQRANKYKSEFLANMSHELRTPLNSLLILAKLLASNEDGNLTPQQVEEALVIYNGGLELLNLINDILDLSKVEAGKLTINQEEIALEAVIKRLKQQFTPVARQSGVEFIVNVDAGIAPQVYTDGQRLEQILKNLLSNAFKFTQKGSVTLTVQPPAPDMVLRGNRDSANAIAFSVTDTGIGIEASKFRDIFEAFQQEDGSIDRHYGGTGLGLTIARKFAHMLGGEVHVASEKNQGSTFTLVLPVRMASQQNESGPAEEEAEASPAPLPRTFHKYISTEEFVADDRKRIGEKDKVLLIIEDDREFARILMKMAHSRGYKCLCAGDGKTGLILASEQVVTGIVLDLTLPDIDGLQVLDQLKHNLATRHIPVHVISGRVEPGDTTPLRKGAIGALAKPAPAEAINNVFTRIEMLLHSEMKQVLVIEDDKNTQVAIQGLLKKKDIAITVVDNGAEATRRMKQTAFDCIILDLRLPDENGFHWLERTEKEFEERALPPIIVYTAQELSEEENRRLNHFTGSIIIKGARSPERLLDEVTLFLHSVESTLSRDQQAIIRMQHDPDKMLQGRTVLLVDDDLRNTFALSRALKKHGMNIIIADNGKMAIEKLHDTPGIEIVLMDIMMPIMDGYEAMRAIRTQSILNSLPIIALTARAMPEEQEKCISAGANDYLTKPVDVERLLMLLRVWLFRQEMAA